jgi:DNA-binding FadR family transcriptional regulator
MSVDRGSGDDIRVTIGGSVQEGGQFAAGRDISQSYVRTHTEGATPVTEADLAELRSAVESVKAQIVAEVQPDQQAAALERIDELEEAVVAAEPDLTTLQYVRKWFGKHLPKLAGSITGLIVHPVVGKIVEAAGDLAARQFREYFGDAASQSGGDGATSGL